MLAFLRNLSNSKCRQACFAKPQGATLPSDNDTFSGTEETLVDQNGSFHGSFISRMSQFNSLHRVDVTINVITAFWSRSRIRSKHPKIEPPSVNKGLVDPSTRTGLLSPDSFAEVLHSDVSSIE
ncbi:hypothetical protein NC651_009704 [Populus alba x Populus x berolinensis]|nr:hypothetical protein NC651_009704 [Populus alba x Populus x berolinensis]